MDENDLYLYRVVWTFIFIFWPDVDQDRKSIVITQETHLSLLRKNFIYKKPGHMPEAVMSFRKWVAQNPNGQLFQFRFRKINS